VRAPWGFCRFPWLICLESPDLNPDESAVSLLASKKDCSIRQATTIRQPPVFLLILEKPPPDPSREETGKYCWKLVLEATSAPVPFARVQSRERDTRQCLPPRLLWFHFIIRLCYTNYTSSPPKRATFEYTRLLLRFAPSPARVVFALPDLSPEKTPRGKLLLKKRAHQAALSMVRPFDRLGIELLSANPRCFPDLSKINF